VNALEELIVEWRETADRMRRLGYADEATRLEDRAEDVEIAWRRTAQEVEWVGIREAREWSGYSADHLRALADEGKIIAEKDGGRWRFQKASLPRKPAGEETNERTTPGRELYEAIRR